LSLKQGTYGLRGPNLVHLILTPATPESLGRALGKAHRRCSAFVNARDRVTGHLFQARFSSIVMDEERLMAAARYGAMNPVTARLVRAAACGAARGLRAPGPAVSPNKVTMQASP
jgi:hypothetical protein